MTNERELVAIDLGEGRAAVVEDRDGALFLAETTPGARYAIRVALDSGRPYRPRALHASPTATVCGGRLAPGAARAIVRTSSGEQIAITSAGCWIASSTDAFLGEAPPVRFENRDGDVVRPPLPSSWLREPVLDASTPCPACGHDRHERLTPDRAVSAHEPKSHRSDLIACARCGWETSLGSTVVSRVQSDPGDGPTSSAPDPVFDNRERMPSADEALDSIDCLYLLDDRGTDRPRVVRHGGVAGEATTQITLAYGNEERSIQVTTDTDLQHAPSSARPHRRDHALRRALEDVSPETSRRWPTGSDAALVLAFEERDRERREWAARIPIRDAAVHVDGTDHPARMGSADDRWAAVADLGDALVSISGHGAPPDLLALRRSLDPLGDVEG